MMSIKKDVNNSFFSILKGEFILNESNKKYIPYMLMLVVFVLINISMSFRAEALLRKSIALENEIVDLRLVYITTKTDLMRMYRRSVMEDVVKNSGIQTSVVPPLIIRMNEDRKN